VALGRDPDASPPPLSQAALRVLRAEGAGALRQLYQALPKVARAPGESDLYFASVVNLDVAMSRVRAPFFIDADLLPGRGGDAFPMVYSFYVEREDEAVVDSPASTPVRVVFLWRLDPLNISMPFLGYTHPRATAAIVLFDQIETELIELVLPALHPGETVGLLDEKTIDPAAGWQRELEGRAAEIVRGTFAGDADAPLLARLGELIGRRRAIVRKWKAELPLVGFNLVPPKRLVPEADYAGELRHRAPKATLDEWDDIHDELLRPTNVALFERLRDRFARTTERHEVQHRIDYARGLVPVPASIVTRLGLDNPLDALPGSFAAHCRDETSAYLAQMADPVDSPSLTLMILSKFLFDRDQWGTAYSCAAVTIFELLSTALALPDAEERLVRNGAVVREALERRLVEITARSQQELHDAARRAWEGAYGGELAKIAVHEVAHNRAWRH
jgi:hypothetical protein